MGDLTTFERVVVLMLALTVVVDAITVLFLLFTKPMLKSVKSELVGWKVLNSVLHAGMVILFLKEIMLGAVIYGLACLYSIGRWPERKLLLTSVDYLYRGEALPPEVREKLPKPVAERLDEEAAKLRGGKTEDAEGKGDGRD